MLKAQLQQSIDYLINRGRAETPVWTIKDMDAQINAAMLGMLSYAADAANTRKWTNWTQVASRPSDPSLVSSFVIDDFKGMICSRAVLGSPAQKATEAARTATRGNIKDLFDRGNMYLDAYHLNATIDCQIP